VYTLEKGCFFFKPKGASETIVGGSGPAPTASVQDSGSDETIQRAAGLVMNISESEVQAVIVDDVNNIVTQGVYVSLGKELPSINVGFELLSVVTDSTGAMAFVTDDVAVASPGRGGDQQQLANGFRDLFSEQQQTELAKLKDKPDGLKKKLEEYIPVALGTAPPSGQFLSAAAALYAQATGPAKKSHQFSKEEQFKLAKSLISAVVKKQDLSSIPDGGKNFKKAFSFALAHVERLNVDATKHLRGFLCSYKKSKSKEVVRRNIYALISAALNQHNAKFSKQAQK